MTARAVETVGAAPPAPAPGAWRGLARRSAAQAVSGWLAPGLAVAYALASVLIAFVGLAASGTIQAQDFGRTAQSLLAVTLWVVPLAGVLAGALAVADDGELSLLLAQPVSWSTVFLARLGGAAAAIAAAVAFAWALTGLIIGGLAGWRDVDGYVAVGAVAVGCAATGVALGGVAGAVGGGRGRALVAALALWFALAVGYDLVAIGTLSVLPQARAGTWTLGLLAALNPFDAARVLGTIGVGGHDLAFGPVTAAIEQSGTTRLPAVLLGSIVAWLAASLGAGAWIFARKER